MTAISEVRNIDCMEYMRQFPDKHFNLAIVDPPYGIGMDGGKIGKGMDMTKKTWDNKIPDPEYFNALFRVSKNQIVWGANYMTIYLPHSRGWIYWDKMQDGFAETFSSGELAWTSFNVVMKHIRYKYQGNYEGYEHSITTKSANPHLLKIHPTQKPVALYKWLLKNYAKEGDKILDTHGGSMSSVIASLDMGFEIHCCELDTEYYIAAKKRIESFLSQTNAFQETPEIIFK